MKKVYARKIKTHQNLGALKKQQDHQNSSARRIFEQICSPVAFSAIRRIANFTAKIIDVDLERTWGLSGRWVDTSLPEKICVASANAAALQPSFDVVGNLSDKFPVK
jgi:hypothetical protein